MEPVTHAERLAALLDGRLDERERAKLMAQLAAPGEELDILADAAAITRELEEEDRAAGVIPIDRSAWRRPPARLLSIAAVFAVASFGTWTLLRSGPATLAPGGTLAMVSSTDSVFPRPPVPGDVVLGSGGPEADDHASGPLGAHLANLAVAARNGQTAAVAAEANAAATLLENAGPGAGALATRFRGLASRPAVPTRSEVRGLAGDAAANANEDLFLLGEWTQTGRVAATLRDARYFARPQSRRYLDARPPEGLSREAVKALAAVREALPEEGAPDWPKLETALADLLKALG